MAYDNKILDFFTGDLNVSDRVELSQQMAGDVVLQEDVRLHQEILFTIKQGDRDVIDFRSQLGQLGQDFLEEKKQHRTIQPINWMAAASIIVLLSVGAYFGILSDSGYTGNNAFSSYYEPFSSSVTVRAQGDLSPMENAIMLYQTGNLSKSLNEFSSLKHENKEIVGFFTGVCNLELGNVEAAISELNIIKESGIYYADHAEWYLAMSYLKQEDVLSAIATLNRVESSNNQYSDRATEILSRLR